MAVSVCVTEAIKSCCTYGDDGGGGAEEDEDEGKLVGWLVVHTQIRREVR